MKVVIAENRVVTPSFIHQSKSFISGKLFYVIPCLMLISIFAILLVQNYHLINRQNILNGIDTNLLIYFLIGFGAQLVDGALGMGYGATSTSLLLSVGVPPAISSTGIHVAEMFSSGASAISHYRFGNINKKLLWYLVIPGVIGSAIGAYILSNLIDGNQLKPFVAIYMLVLAVIIIKKAFKKQIKKPTKNLGILAIFGGFMDAVGGGGWGPIVTSTLIGRGRDPRYTIGSVNAAEFAVSFASGITFLIFLGINSWQVILGLILGGLVAAPLGGYLVNKINRKPAMILVGFFIIVLSLRNLFKLFGWL